MTIVQQLFFATNKISIYLVISHFETGVIAWRVNHCKSENGQQINVYLLPS